MSKTLSHSVRICSALPNPDGSDFGNETVTVINPPAVNLTGWTLRDMGGHTYNLSGSVDVGGETTFVFDNNDFPLNNKGDIVYLFDATGAVAHRVDYDAKDISPGKVLTFPDPNGPGKPPVSAQISAMLPDPEGKDDGKESITIKGLVASPADLTGWKFTDKAGHTSDLAGELQPGEKRTFVLKPDQVSLNNKGDELTLVDANGAVVHSVIYKQSQVHSGVYVDFDVAKPAPTPGKARLPTVTIASAVPAPLGGKRAGKTVTVKVRGRQADLKGWKLRDGAGNTTELQGTVSKKGQKTISIPANAEGFKADGDKIALLNPDGDVVHEVEYAKDDVTSGAAIDFAMTHANPRGVVARVPTVVITSVLAKPDGQEGGRGTVSVASRGGLADVDGWTVKDTAGKTVKLEGMIGNGKERTFMTGDLSLDGEETELTLCDAAKKEVHSVKYGAKDVQTGVVIDFGVSAEDPDAGMARVPTVQICSMLPNPDGVDAGRELVVLKARGGSTSLSGWSLTDSSGHKFPLAGEIRDGEDKSVLLTDKKFALNNKGDSITLWNDEGEAVNVATYEEDEVVSGVLVDFGTTKDNVLVGKGRVPTVMIARLLPDPRGDDSLRETITVKARGGSADLSGWRVKDKGGHEFKLSGVVEDEKTFRVATLSMSVEKDGDVISLIDKYGREVHRVRYTGADVVTGKELEF